MRDHKLRPIPRRPGVTELRIPPAVVVLAAVALGVFGALGGCGKQPLSGLRFAAMGATGTGGAAQRDFARQMAVTHRDWGADFVLLIGDNFYSSGVVSVGNTQAQTE